MGRLPPEVESERRRLHSLGLNDREIGEETNTPQTTITNWRLRCGLPTHNPKKLAGGEAVSLTLGMWVEGFTDKEIESVLGYLPTQERGRLGLPPNRKCQTCDAPIGPRKQFCSEHLSDLNKSRDEYLVARTVLRTLSRCVGDNYRQVRKSAVEEFPWLEESVERWENDGRIGRF